MQRARIGEIELEYEIRGSGETMLLIHGASLADAMRPLAMEPALERFGRLTYHRRGYAGSSPVTGPVSVDEHADDVAGLLGQLGVARAHVVGHSSGGLIALGVSLRHPELVESLVLLEPPLLQLPGGVAFVEAVGPLVEQFAAGDPAAAMHGFLAGVGGEGWREAIDRTVPGGVAQAERNAATFFTSELPGVGAWRFGPEMAAQISVPVLCVAGGASAALFGESHRQLMSWIGHAREATIPNATHLLPMEQPAAVAEAISEFCAAVSTHTA